MAKKRRSSGFLKGRKAEGEQELFVNPLIAIAGLIVLIFLISIIFSGSDRQGKDKLCLGNAIATASMKQGSIVEIDPVKLVNCPTYIVNVKDSDIDDSGKIGDAKKYMDNMEKKSKDPDLFKNFPDTPKMSPETFVANKLVAEEMRSCWTKLGQGKLDLFTAWKGFVKTPFFCVICSRIAFDEKAQSFIKKYNENKEYDTEINSMNIWLKNNPVPATKMSYWEYLKDEEEPESDLFINYQYDISKPIAVIFARSNIGAGVEMYNRMITVTNSAAGYALPALFITKKLWPVALATGAIEAISGKTITAFLGLDKINEVTSIDKVILMPYDSEHIGKLCMYLMN